MIPNKFFTSTDEVPTVPKIRKTIAKSKVKTPVSKRAKPILKPSKKKQRVGRTKEYMKFDFYFKRTCFRTMTLYYKTIFKPYFQRCKGLLKNESVLVVVREFAQ